MTTYKERVVLEVYKTIEASEPDISSERLLYRTVESATELLGIPLDISDVVEVLARAPRPTTDVSGDPAEMSRSFICNLCHKEGIAASCPSSWGIKCPVFGN